MKRVALTRVFVFRSETWDKRGIMPASAGLENSTKERLFAVAYDNKIELLLGPRDSLRVCACMVK